MELLYFSDITQLEYVLACQPSLLDRLRPITGDMVVSYELERLGIEFIDEWNYIQTVEIEHNWNEAFRLSKEWWDESLADTKYGAEALAKSVQMDMVYPFQACLNARTVYSTILNTFPIEKIHGFFLPPVAVIRTGPAPTVRCVRSVSESVLFFMAEKRGIVVQKLNSKYPLSKKLNSISVHPKSKKIERDWSAAAKSYPVQKIIVIYRDVMSANEYNAIKESFNNMPDVKVILVTQDDLALGAKFKEGQSNIERRLSVFWSKFLEFSLGYDGQYPEIFSNHYLHFQFERIKSEMLLAVNNGDVFQVLLDILKPSLVLFGYEALTLERVLVGLAQNSGIHTIGLKHGGVYPMHSLRWASGRVDRMLIWSEDELKDFESYGVIPSKLKPIGSIQYEADYLRYDNKSDDEVLLRLKQLSKKKFQLSEDKPLIVLVTAEINTGFANPIAHPSKHRDSIRDFIELVDERPDLQFVIKPHPSFDYYDLYRRLQHIYRPNLKFIEQALLSEIIEAADICIMINYCTTASLEAMFKRIPVVYLNNAVYPIDDWRDNLLETGVSRVTSMLELKNTIDCLLKNTEVKKKALDNADKQIKKMLGINDSTPSQRFIDYIAHELVATEAQSSGKLSSEQPLINFIDTNLGQEKNIRFYELAKNHSGDHLMFAFSYLSGKYNLGYSALFSIFQLFDGYVENEQLETWRKARWLLMPAYILGNIDGGSQGGEDNFKFLAIYLTNPRKLIATPTWLKISVAKYVIQSIFGYKSYAITRIIHKIREKHFGFS